MTDMKQIERIMFKIGRLWVLHSQQGLGQVLSNYVFPNNQNPFYIEDKQVEKQLDKLLKKNKK